MKSIKIDASPKQLSKLRNGHKVRVRSPIEGMGFNLLVDPSKFDAMSRAFTKNTAVQVNLSPEELKANRDAIMSGEIEGQGIFKGGKLTEKKVLKGIVSAEKKVRKNPAARKIVRKVLPLLVEEGTKAALQYYGADKETTKIGSKLGKQVADVSLESAGYGLYAGRGLEGDGLYAGRGLEGDGLYAGRGLGGFGLGGFGLGGFGLGAGFNGPPSRMPEMSSIAIGGNLLKPTNSALQPDAYSENFAMNTQLPVQYQRVKFR